LQHNTHTPPHQKKKKEPNLSITNLSGRTNHTSHQTIPE
jgi:hypothetical protein